MNTIAMSEDQFQYGSLKRDWELNGLFEEGGPVNMVQEPTGPNRINGFRDLRVWQGGMKLVSIVYRDSRKFPKEEMYGLTSQIRRASVSVPSNVAEGWGRNKTGYFQLGLSYARGSLHEVETQLLIGEQEGWLSAEELSSTMDHINILSAGLLNFMNKLEQKR